MNQKIHSLKKWTNQPKTIQIEPKTSPKKSGPHLGSKPDNSPLPKFLLLYGEGTSLNMLNGNSDMSSSFKILKSFKNLLFSNSLSS